MNFLDLICCLHANPQLDTYKTKIFLNDNLYVDNHNNHNKEEYEKKMLAIQTAYVLEWKIDNEQKTIIVSLIDKESFKKAINQ